MNIILKQLYEEIKHGDEHHQTWLWDKIVEFDKQYEAFKFIMAGAVDAGWPCALKNEHGDVHGFITGTPNFVMKILDQLHNGETYDINIPRKAADDLPDEWRERMKESPSNVKSQYRLKKQNP